MVLICIYIHTYRHSVCLYGSMIPENLENLWRDARRAMNSSDVLEWYMLIYICSYTYIYIYIWYTYIILEHSKDLWRDARRAINSWCGNAAGILCLLYNVTFTSIYRAALVFMARRASRHKFLAIHGTSQILKKHNGDATEILSNSRQAASARRARAWRPATSIRQKNRGCKHKSGRRRSRWRSQTANLIFWVSKKHYRS